MNLRRSAVALLAAAAVALPAASAGAFYDPVRELEFPEQQVWFRSGAQPVGNVDTVQGTPISWDVEEPTGSGLTAGGLTVGNNYSAFVGDRYENTLTVRGAFTGLLDTLAVDLWWRGPAQAACTDMNLAFDLRIDGVPILVQEQSAPSAGLATSPDGDNMRTRFMFTRLHEAMEEYGVDTGPDVAHTVDINFANFYACNEAVWLYDTVETPSGMTFNLDPKGKAARQYTKVDVFDPPPPLAS